MVAGDINQPNRNGVELQVLRRQIDFFRRFRQQQRNHFGNRHGGKQLVIIIFPAVGRPHFPASGRFYNLPDGRARVDGNLVSQLF